MSDLFLTSGYSLTHPSGGPTFGVHRQVPDGNIILIRFIRSDRMLSVFGEKVKVAKNLAYAYVKAVIVTEIHQLQIYLGDDLVGTFDYELSTD